MTPKQLPPRHNRALLLAAAALGGIVLGLLVMRLFSADDDDVAVGVVPEGARVPAQTTTSLPAPVLSAEATGALVSPRDPFGQLVTAPQAAEGGEGTQPAPAPAAEATQPAPGLAAQATQPAPAPAAETQPAPAPAAEATQPAPAPAAEATPTALGTETTLRAPSSTPTTTTTTPPQTVQPQPVAPIPSATTAPPALPPSLVWGTVGPVAVPGEPVNVCVVRGTSSCSSTAPATSVTLTAAASIDPAAVTAPTVLPAACSNGRGAALLVNTGSAGTTVYVSVAVMVNGSPAVVSLTLPAPSPNEAIILSACVSPDVGAPSAGAAPPPPPTSCLLDGLLDGLLPPLLALLGGAPAPVTSGAAPRLLGLPWHDGAPFGLRASAIGQWRVCTVSK